MSLAIAGRGLYFANTQEKEFINMPYYVYRIRTNNRDNHLYNSFEKFSDAEELEKQMMEGWRPGDDYFVRMFFAENDQEAEIKANNLSPHPKFL